MPCAGKKGRCRANAAGLQDRQASTGRTQAGVSLARLVFRLLDLRGARLRLRGRRALRQPLRLQLLALGGAAADRRVGQGRVADTCRAATAYTRHPHR